MEADTVNGYSEILASAMPPSSFIIIIVPVIITIFLSPQQLIMPAYGQSDEEAHDASSSDSSTIDYATIGYWVGFFGLGGATGILLVHRLVLQHNRLQLLKYVIAALAITTGIIHLLLIQEHLEESLLFGVFFASSGTGLLAYSVVVRFSSNKIVYYVGIGGSVILIGLYLFTRLVTVPFSEESGVEAISGLDIVTQVVQIALLGVLIYVIAAQRKLETIKML